MSALPDPRHLRDLAARVAGQATVARSHAARLDQAVAAARGWSGPAATAFAGPAAGVRRGLHTSAGRLDVAAVELRRHADRVEDVLGRLRALGVDLAADGREAVALLREGLDPDRVADALTRAADTVGDAATDTAGVVGHGVGGAGAAVGHAVGGAGAAVGHEAAGVAGSVGRGAGDAAHAVGGWFS